MVIYPKDLNKFGTFSLKDIDAVFNLDYKAAVDELSGEAISRILDNNPELS